MIGNGAIGEWAIGEDDLDNASVNVVSPETARADASEYDPRISGGASGYPDAIAASAALVAPVVAAGASSLPLVLEASATVEFAVAAGASIKVDTWAASASLPGPKISSGSVVKPDSPFISAEAFDPTTDIGNVVISPVSIVTYSMSPGGIGDGAIGEFGIGEGDDFEQVIIGRLRIYAISPAPKVSAGASIWPPVAPADVIAGNPEIDARERNIRFLAIAS